MPNPKAGSKPGNRAGRGAKDDKMPVSGAPKPETPPNSGNRKKANRGNPMPSGRGNGAPRKTRNAGQALSAEREQIAFALRVAGANWPQIAQQMGCAISTAYEAFQRTIKRTRDMTREQAEEWREIALARCESLVRAHHENRSHPRSAEVILKATKLEIDLIPGAKAPDRQELSGPAGGPLEFAEYENLTAKEREEALAELEASVVEDVRVREESKTRQKLARAREREAEKPKPVTEPVPAPEPTPEPPKKKKSGLPAIHPAGWKPVPK